MEVSQLGVTSVSKRNKKKKQKKENEDTDLSSLSAQIVEKSGTDVVSEALAQILS